MTFDDLGSFALPGPVHVSSFPHKVINPCYTRNAQAAHVKQPLIQHGLLCAEDGKEWKVPLTGTLRVKFVQEPSADRTLGEMSTDGGVDCLIKNIRQSPTDDTRKRLFELATCNSGTYFTSYQVRSKDYHFCSPSIRLRVQPGTFGLTGPQRICAAHDTA